MSTVAASLVFTGHMIDLPDRPMPRFPPMLEAAAAAAIESRIASVMTPGMLGLASGARGGDILFHEAARALGLATMIVLPFAPELFEGTSVTGVATGDWRRRFWDLWNATPERGRLVLDLPLEAESFAICNARLVELAEARGPFRLLALWDGRESGLAGGTDDLLRRAVAAGAEIDIVALSDLAP